MNPSSLDAPVLAGVEHAVARALVENAAADEAERAMLGAIGSALGWDLGGLWEADGAARSLTCVHTWHAPGVDPAGFAASSRDTVLAFGEGLPGRVVAAETPAWVEDVTADANFPRATAAVSAGLRGAFCFPIRGSEGTLGAIEFLARDLRAPDDALLATMARLGDQIGRHVERRRAQERVLVSEARMRAMLDAALDCVIAMDHTGHVLGFNRAAERAFGYSAEEALGRDMAELIVPPALRERHRRGLARYVAGGDPKFLGRRVEIVGMRADGSEFPVELTIARIDLPGPPTFTGYLRDITDQKRAEAELRASRARLIDAGDEARRQLERDLHDGAQQRLVGLALALRLARRRLDDDPAAAAELLDSAIEELHESTVALRELARGIHPAILVDGGLEHALPDLAARSAVPTRVAGVVSERLAPRIEAAAYFVVAEGLTNVARYAGAARAEVRAVRRRDDLIVEVRDDGRGGATLDGGTGLRGLADRLAALDGRLDVSSPPGGGTVLRAEIPCVS